MGTHINNEEIENEKINEDDIIENDCYEEIDMRKINQIIEKEKIWNNNTIVYTNNNIINISNIEIENENEKKPKVNEEKEENNDDNNKIKLDVEQNKEEKEEDKKEEEVENKKKEQLKNSNIKYIPPKKMLHVMPKIKPKNTSDEALNSEISKNSRKNLNNITKENQNQDKKKEEKGNEQSNEFDIENILPNFKKNRLKEDEIIYSGTLEKILNVTGTKRIAYSKRFCVLTKKYFAYYKSKESFISLNKPMFMVENNDIIRIENTFLEGDGYFGIVCDVNDRTKNLIYKVSSFVTKDENNSQLLLGFRTNNLDEMTKWLILLNYFISQKDNNA